MANRTRPARAPLMLGLAALALLQVGAFAPSLLAAQTPTQTPADAPAVGDPVNKEWVLHALRDGRVGEAEIIRQVEARGSSFYPTAEEGRELGAAGATGRLIEAVRKNYAPGIQSGAGSGGTGFGPGRGHNTGGHARKGGGTRAGGGVDYTRPFRQNEVTLRAAITFKPEPGYTEVARKNNVTGVVRLRAVLNLSGEVTDIYVIKGLPDGLSERCVAAAKRIKFTPAQKDGRKVSQYVVLEYNFGFGY